MRSNQLFVLLFAVLLFACKKESLPPGSPPSSNAVFSPVSNGVICSSTTVSGVYTVGNFLDASNGVTLQVNVTAIGSYSVYTDTINGISFSDTGSFVHTGVQNIQLKGKGKPLAVGLYAYLFTAGSGSCRFTVSSAAAPQSGYIDNDHMYFGNPSNAVETIDSTTNYLMRREYYALSYSSSRGTPNWVSWHLYTPDLGATPRQDNFRPDVTLPAGWYQVQANAYTSSGFDRGHNIPSGDRTSTVEANSSTFLMTNMIPQAPNLNQKAWATFEDSLRRLVNLGNELYIVMGSYGTGGTGSSGYATTINGGKVTVPANIWKIALVMPNGNNDSSRVDANTRLIAINMPNNNSVNANWKSYRVTVDAIEAATGYDLLRRLPVSLQAVLEAKLDSY